ncbi:MAG: UMP kinase [Prevotellaceae bacterium]|jgi:uridylate kinase|nr:UMP kinase [Prevotellaceae bacterium]
MALTYKRILLKLSGESLTGDSESGINPVILSQYAQNIKDAAAEGTQIGVVIGGGNIFRGLNGVDKGFDRVKGDQMGMLATVINSLAIQSALLTINVKAVILTSVTIESIGERFSKDLALSYLNHNTVCIIAGGTGNPFFTTDSAAALRAAEIEADVLLKGTRVDGIYTADPEKDPKAVKYTQLTFDEAYGKNLKIMDLTAFTLCKENHIPIIVFDMNHTGNLLRIVQGEPLGTVVGNAVAHPGI